MNGCPSILIVFNADTWEPTETLLNGKDENETMKLAELAWDILRNLKRRKRERLKNAL